MLKRCERETSFSDSTVTFSTNKRVCSRKPGVGFQTKELRRENRRKREERANQYIMVNECVFSIYYSEGRKYYITSTVPPYLLPVEETLLRELMKIKNIINKNKLKIYPRVDLFLRVYTGGKMSENNPVFVCLFGRVAHSHTYSSLHS